MYIRQLRVGSTLLLPGHSLRNVMLKNLSQLDFLLSMSMLPLLLYCSCKCLATPVKMILDHFLTHRLSRIQTQSIVQYRSSSLKCHFNRRIALLHWMEAFLALRFAESPHTGIYNTFTCERL